MSEAVSSKQALIERDPEWYHQRGIDDARVIEVLERVPRKPFVISATDESGEQLPSKALPPLEVVGKLLSALDLSADDKILEIGTDTGYITALLGALGNEVYSVERRLPMAKLAEGRLEAMSASNVEVLYGPRLTEYALNAPYDAILLSAIAPRVPAKLKQRLAVGGRMVVPIGEGSKNPEVICIRRVDDERFERHSLGQLRFSSKIGDILVELGIADREDVELAALEADAQGQRVGETLLEHALVQESDLVRALAIQRGHKVAPVDTLIQIADHELAMSVPRAFLRHHQVIPLAVREEKLHVASVDPDAPTVELARLSDAKAVETYLVTTAEFRQIWNTLLEGRQQHEAQINSLKQRVEYKLEKVFQAAHKLDATAIHIDPDDQGAAIRFRVQGKLRHIPEMALDANEIDYAIEFLKLQAGLDPRQDSRPQRGRLSWARKPHLFHLRLKVMPSIRGQQLILEVLAQGQNPASLTDLGFPDYFGRNVEVLLERLGGLFLIVGPRRAQKKKTLYGLIDRLASDEEKKVCLVEEQILGPLERAHQIPLDPEDGFGYRQAIASLADFDTDVVGLSEIPDPATALEAIRCARQGPAVLATLHGKDAGHILEGMRRFGVPSEEIAAGLSGILTQWQAPLICEHCRELVPLSQKEVAAIFGRRPIPEDFRAFRGAGCHHCHGTGHQGTFPIWELLPFGASLKEAVLHRADEVTLRQRAEDSGVELLADYAARMASEGLLPIGYLERFLATS